MYTSTVAIPISKKRSILQLCKSIYQIPHDPNPVEESTNLLGAIYQEIAQKIPNTPIPTPMDVSNITPIMMRDYLHIPELIRKEIEHKYHIPLTTTATTTRTTPGSTIHAHPKYFYRIKLPRNRRQIDIGIWGDCTKKESILISYKMIQWLYYLDETLPLNSACSNTLTIYFFMTDHVKKLPSNQETMQSKKLEPIHVNSAFTYGCTKNNRIFLFRKEEWFKAFIHESMHALGVDFSSESEHEMQNSTNVLIKQCFHGIRSHNLCIFESYTEIWAELMNILISVFESTHYTKYNSTVKKRVESMIQLEMTWSLIQAAKIMQYYKIQDFKFFFDNKRIVYQENRNPRNGNNEWETCIFSYYILKSVLYFYWIPFLKWCNCSKSNSKCILFDSKRVSSFVQFLCKYAKGKHYQNALFIVNKYQDILRDPTLIMSIWGKYHW